MFDNDNDPLASFDAVAYDPAPAPKKKSKLGHPLDNDWLQNTAGGLEDQGFTVTSTSDGRHNRGSKHPLGDAFDLRTKDQPPEVIDRTIRNLRQTGNKVIDERAPQPGVWSGQHIHVEKPANTTLGGRKPQAPTLNDDPLSSFDAVAYDPNAQAQTGSQAATPAPAPKTNRILPAPTKNGPIKALPDNQQGPVPTDLIGIAAPKTDIVSQVIAENNQRDAQITRQMKKPVNIGKNPKERVYNVPTVKEQQQIAADSWADQTAGDIADKAVTKMNAEQQAAQAAENPKNPIDNVMGRLAAPLAKAPVDLAQYIIQEAAKNYRSTAQGNAPGPERDIPTKVAESMTPDFQREIGDPYRKAVDEGAGVDPNAKGFWNKDLPDLVGGLAPLVAGAALTKNAGVGNMLNGPRLASMYIGAAQASVSTYQSAKNMGADEATALDAASKMGQGSALLFALPGVNKTIAEFMKAGVHPAEIAHTVIQIGGQTVADNLIAAKSYDPSRPWDYGLDHAIVTALLMGGAPIAAKKGLEKLRGPQPEAPTRTNPEYERWPQTPVTDEASGSPLTRMIYNNGQSAIGKIVGETEDGRVRVQRPDGLIALMPKEQVLNQPAPPEPVPVAQEAPVSGAPAAAPVTAGASPVVPAAQQQENAATAPETQIGSKFARVLKDGEEAPAGWQSIEQVGSDFSSKRIAYDPTKFEDTAEAVKAAEARPPAVKGKITKAEGAPSGDVSHLQEIYGVDSHPSFPDIVRREETRGEIGTTGKFHSTAHKVFQDSNGEDLPPLIAHPELRKMLNLPDMPSYDSGEAYTHAAQHTMDALAELVGKDRSSKLNAKDFDTISHWLAYKKSSKDLITLFEKTKLVAGRAVENIHRMFDDERVAPYLKDINDMLDRGETPGMQLLSPLKKVLKRVAGEINAESTTGPHERLAPTAIDRFVRDLRQGNLSGNTSGTHVRLFTERFRGKRNEQGGSPASGNQGAAGTTPESATPAPAPAAPAPATAKATELAPGEPVNTGKSEAPSTEKVSWKSPERGKKLSNEDIEHNLKQVPKAADGELDPESRAVEDRFRKWIAEDPQRAIDEAKKRFGKVINTDDMRELSPDYSASAEARGRFSPAVHEPASWLAKELYKQALSEPPKEGESPLVLATAGGTGAGKTTGIDAIDSAREVKDSAQIVLDGNLNNAAKNIEKIQQALDAGKRVHLIAVYRDIVEAWKNGVLPRAERPDYGRTVPPHIHIDTHTSMFEALAKTQQHFANDPRVKFTFIDNSLGRDANKKSLAQISTIDIFSNRLHTIPSVDDLLKETEVAHEKGKIGDRVRNGIFHIAGRTEENARPERSEVQGRSGSSADETGVREQSESKRGEGTAAPGAVREGVKGKETSVTIPRGESIPARYEVREASDLIASHHSISFQPNEKYAPLVNDRDYTDKVNHADIVTNTLPKKFKPELVLSDDPTAANGPPVIEAGGRVLGGNSRTMMIQRLFETSPEEAQKYVNALKEKAGQFKLDPKEIEGMKQPVLVRVADTEGKDLQKTISQLNFQPGKAMTRNEQAVADAKNISNKTVEFLAGKMQEEGARGTLAKIMEGKTGRDMVEKLIEDGTFPEGDRNKLLDAAGATKVAKERIQQMVLGRLARNKAQIDELPASVKLKLERAVAPLLRLEGTEWDMTGEVKKSLDAVIESLKKDVPVQDLGKLRSFDFAEKQGYSPEEIAIARALRNDRITEVERKFREFAAAHDDSARPMFASEAESKGAAFDRIFNKQEAPEPKLVQEARERVQNRIKKGQLNSGLDPEHIKDLAITTGYDIYKGVRDFAEWSKEMVKRLGEDVKPKLKEIFENVAKATHFESNKAYLEKQAEKVTQSPKFKRWFGDSRVVNEKTGEPLVVYHGTPVAGFDKFETPSYFTSSPGESEMYSAGSDDSYALSFKGKRTSEDFGDPDKLKDGISREDAHWWEPNEWHIVGDAVLRKIGLTDYGNPKLEMSTAGMVDYNYETKKYERRPFKSDGYQPATYPVYLSIKNPAYLSAQEGARLSGMGGERGSKASPLVEKLKAEGYDGVIADSDWSTGKHYIPFYPEQIKAAFGNKEFSPTDANITHSVFGGVPGAGKAIGGAVKWVFGMEKRGASKEKIPFPQAFDVKEFLNPINKALQSKQLSAKDQAEWNKLRTEAQTAMADKDYGRFLAVQNDARELLQNKKFAAVEGLGILARTISLGGEISAVGRQGGIPAIRHFNLWMQQWPKLAKGIGSKEGYYNTLAKIYSDPNHSIAQKIGVDFATAHETRVGEGALSREENMVSGLGEKLPILPELERGNRAFLDGLRQAMFDYHLQRIVGTKAIDFDSVGKTPKKGEAPEVAQLRQIAKWINVMTGRGDLGEKMTAFANTTSQVFTSPRLSVSRFQAIDPTRASRTSWKTNSDAPLSEKIARLADPVMFLSKDPKGYAAREIARTQAQLAVTSGLAGAALIYGLKAAGIQATTSFDPDNPDFLKLRVGNARYSLLVGGMDTAVKFSARLAKLTYMSATGKESGEEAAGKAGTMGMKFLRYKESPLFSYLHDQLWERVMNKTSIENEYGDKVRIGKNAVGEYKTYGDSVKDRILLWEGSLVDAYQLEGWPGVAKMLPEAIGHGSQLYQSAFEKIGDQEDGNTAQIKRQAKLVKGKVQMEPHAAYMDRVEEGKRLFEEYHGQLKDDPRFQDLSRDEQKAIEKSLRTRIENQTKNELTNEGGLTPDALLNAKEGAKKRSERRRQRLREFFQSEERPD